MMRNVDPKSTSLFKLVEALAGAGKSPEHERILERFRSEGEAMRERELAERQAHPEGPDGGPEGDGTPVKGITPRPLTPESPHIKDANGRSRE